MVKEHSAILLQKKKTSNGDRSRDVYVTWQINNLTRSKDAASNFLGGLPRARKSTIYIKPGEEREKVFPEKKSFEEDPETFFWGGFNNKEKSGKKEGGTPLCEPKGRHASTKGEMAGKKTASPMR